MRAFSASCLIFASRARIFSSREFFAMPDLSKVSLAAALTCSSLRTRSYLASFSRPTFLPPAKVSVAWIDIGYPDAVSANVQDLWTKKESSAVKGGYSAEVPSHGVAMIRVKP